MDRQKQIEEWRRRAREAYERVHGTKIDRATAEALLGFAEETLREAEATCDRATAELSRPSYGTLRDPAKDFQPAGERLVKLLQRDQDNADAAFAPSRLQRILLGGGTALYPVHSFFPVGEQKADFWREAKNTIVEGDVTGTASTFGERLPLIVTKPRRRLTLREFLPSRPIEGSHADFLREKTFTNAASPQVEGSSKGESTFEYELVNAAAQVIAHHVTASAQILDDWPGLGRIITEELAYGLALKAETELLSGDGLGSHLTGLTVGATSYAATYLAANDTKLDTVRHAFLELEDDDEEPDFIVLNPKDLHDIELIKSEDSGTANTGQYLVSMPTGQQVEITTIWGRVCIKTNSMASGSFLVGNSRSCTVLDRMKATVAISNSHDQNFTKNLLTLRGEERIGLAIHRASSFVYGTF